MTGASGKCVGFYAPMKSPHHPVPSGDRAMARNLIQLLQTDADVQLVSEFNSRDKAGDPDTQQRLIAEAEAEANRLIQDLPALDLWVTYHCYYKAPDLIGPKVAQARGIPYVQIESTRAKKRLNGRWDLFARAAHTAADAADVIFYLTEQDHMALLRDKPTGQTLAPLAPFLPRDSLPQTSDLTGPMLSVGMMRAGDKLASYTLIADTLQHLSGDWSLDIAGDGPMRHEVEALMARYGARVQFLGQCDAATLEQAYTRASLFLWPGVKEAFGMVYLEAQAHGMPVVAQDRPGLRDVLSPQNKSTMAAIADGGSGLAQAIADLTSNRAAAQDRGTKAAQYIARHHLAPAAAHQLWRVLNQQLEGHI